jgi:type IX secretion system PorP/SprF family membrane protein
MMMKRLFTLSLVSAIVATAFAQDPEFTQFYANKLYLNPAFAGSHNCPRVVMNYRNQWPAITGNYVTTAFAYDQHVDGIKGGLGLLVTNDQAGQSTLKTTRVSGMYSYRQPLGRKFSIKFGMEATYFQKSLDWSKLTFGDMIDPRRGFVYQTNDIPRGGSVSGIDFGAGVIGYSDVFYAGFAVHHLTEPNESLILGASPLPMKYTFHAGANIPLDGPTASKYSKGGASISPNILFRQQDNFTQLNMGIYIKKDALVGGIWYRNKDAFIVTLGIQSDYIKIGYSYDVTVSKLGTGTGGAHEITLGIDFTCKPKKRTFRTISCPSF